ncbi:terminase [Methylopila jiangsuensis]|uniref:Terminase n=1 Tax=Methylopila jiangsuensis TaxID=586230 RepID=A0A9W6JJI7_9HYPH|nr:phage terminase small subunit P27 family [Methylopila jiangsuensis]MDR6286947.1 P27 family predicted phage terminase small subunit [Methylopila jiangsuensis]GLK76703.1 terminase [Methylopila jiangsuensis]
MRGAKPNLKPAARPVLDASRPPAWLSKDAKAEWKRVMPLLIERRILSDADLGSLENYAVSIGRVREIERLIQSAGVDPALFRMQDKAIQTARQLASELGLTPVSRSRPALNEEPDEDDTSPLAE